MTQPAEAQSGPPPGDRDAQIFELEQKRRQPQNAFERFLLTSQGSKMLRGVFEKIDDSHIIVKTVFTMEQDFVSGHIKTPYAQLLHRQETKMGLDRRDLQRLYIGNRAASAALGSHMAAANTGDEEATATFFQTMRLFHQGIRYEWLRDTYDPDAEAWQHRYHHLGVMRGNTLRLDLQPGHKRPDVTHTDRRFALTKTGLRQR